MIQSAWHYFRKAETRQSHGFITMIFWKDKVMVLAVSKLSVPTLYFVLLSLCSSLSLPGPSRTHINLSIVSKSNTTYDSNVGLIRIYCTIYSILVVDKCQLVCLQKQLCYFTFRMHFPFLMNSGPQCKINISMCDID